MRSLQIVIGFLIIMLSCKSNNPIELNYCEMLSKDQSFVDDDEIDTKKQKSNHENRKKLILENFEQLIHFTRREGFPSINAEELPRDSCKYWSITMTLIHVAQSYPEKIFNNETITLFENEIEKGNLKSKDLIGAFKISFVSNKFCEELKQSIEKAIKSWKMESHITKEARYKPCD